MIITTGAESGLGRYIHQHLGGSAWVRSTTLEEMEAHRQEGVDAIIHCAFNSSKNVTQETLAQYIQDNVFLTRELAAIPQRKFVLISTVDVYPCKNSSQTEDALIRLDDVSGIYPTTKLMSEAVVIEGCENFLILRVSAMLGRDSRKNSLIKILEDESCLLSLSGESRFNYVLHSDILKFIEQALKDDIRGIYNITSTGNISLQEVAEMSGRKVQFGTYRYDAGMIDNARVCSVFPEFRKSSGDVVKQFIEER